MNRAFKVTQSRDMKTISLKTRLLLSLLGITLASWIMGQYKPDFPGSLHGNFDGWAAIVALELIDTPAKLEALLPLSKGGAVKEQSLEAVALLKPHTCWDFLFIVLYTLFFYYLARLTVPSAYRKISIGLALAVALMDVGENIFLLAALEKHAVGDPGLSSSISLMYGFAFTKWTLIFLLLLYLGYFALGEKRKGLRLAFTVVYGLFILSFLFFPTRHVDYLGNPTQATILASLPVILTLLMRALGRRSKEPAYR